MPPNHLRYLQSRRDCPAPCAQQPPRLQVQGRQDPLRTPAPRRAQRVTVPRVTDGGNKDGSAHHRAANVALWREHTAKPESASGRRFLITKICCFLWHVGRAPDSRRAKRQHSDSLSRRRRPRGALKRAGGILQRGLRAPRVSHVCTRRHWRSRILRKRRAAKRVPRSVQRAASGERRAAGSV